MLRFLAKPKILAGSFFCLLITFILAIFVVNPAIDGVDGSGVLALQLAFNKQLGIEIIEKWGDTGRKIYLTWGFIDYLYAVAYALFLAAVLSAVILKTGMNNSFLQKTPLLPFAAGAFDWLENIMEFFFVRDPHGFSQKLFFFHSSISIGKWIMIALTLATLMLLLIKWFFSTSAFNTD